MMMMMMMTMMMTIMMIDYDDNNNDARKKTYSCCHDQLDDKQLRIPVFSSSTWSSIQSRYFYGFVFEKLKVRCTTDRIC